jgi:hypothetical protein
MRPKSLSASALSVAELCLARYKAEQIERGRGAGNSAASVGTSVHGALEMFVKATRPELGGNPAMGGLDTIEMFYRTSYMDTFNTSDASGEFYDDGWDLVKKWHGRQDWEGVTVLSAEVKENFPVKAMFEGSQIEIPFNYIWDRHDQIGPTEYRVVDYKTNRWGIRPDDLKKKIQARCYGLAAQIKYPEATRIWVQFDMLRHDPVGIVYSRDENIATWRFIRDLTQRILDTPVDAVKETLNPECRFCVRKLKCSALQANIAVGGALGITSAKEAVDIRATLEYQKSAIESAIRDLDEIVLTEARATDVLEFESDMNRLKIGVSGRRGVDAERARMVLGDDLFGKYGSASITLGTVEKLLKGKDLTEDQKKQLRGLIKVQTGEPRVKVEPKNSLEED